MSDFRLVLVTPETTLLDEEVESLIFPLYDGMKGVLKAHAPFVGRLGQGDLSVTFADGRTAEYTIDGGFAQMDGVTCSLLTDRAVAKDPAA